MRERYVEQVRLLVRLLPATAAEEVFALKGGSAINLFYRDMPRLSVDIDLTYVPVEDRAVSLQHIDATLDRQHPRDLYDVHLLYENEGLTDDLFRVFLVYVCASGRPPHELLAPPAIPIEEMYTEEFVGMTREEIALSDLETARTRLIADIRSRLTGKSAAFLLSLHNVEPDFALIDLPQAERLPAIQWKLLNLRKLKAENPAKHAEQGEMLKALFA